jgi:hypothetical protein
MKTKILLISCLFNFSLFFAQVVQGCTVPDDDWQDVQNPEEEVTAVPEEQEPEVQIAVLDATDKEKDTNKDSQQDKEDDNKISDCSNSESSNTKLDEEDNTNPKISKSKYFESFWSVVCSSWCLRKLTCSCGKKSKNI